MTDVRNPPRAPVAVPVAVPVADAGLVPRVAALFMVLAVSVDALLPALPYIAADLAAAAPNRAQLVVPAFVLGLGFGTLVAGPLADAWGRRTAILLGLGAYVAGALIGAGAQNLEVLLLGRLVQGLGAAFPKVAAMALIRDRTEGRRMARLVSALLVVNVVVPAAAPSLALPLLDEGGWRAVLLAMATMGALVWLWIALRQPETLPVRQSLDWPALAAATAGVLGNRLTRLYICALAVAGAQIQALLSLIQPVYEQTYGLGAAFPTWFLASGVLACASNFANALLVMRFGMRRLAIAAYSAQAAFVAALLAGSALFGDGLPFPLFFAWTVSIFAAGGLTFGNLNALALEPYAHRAGLAAAVIGATATLMSVAIAAPISQLFDGTPRPLMIGLLATSCAGWIVLARARRLDPTPHHEDPGPRP